LGVDSNTGQEFAIKEFSKTRLRKQEMFKVNGFGRGRGRGRGMAAMKKPDSPFEYIKGEIAVMKKLNHPNILKLFEVLDDPTGDNLYMVFELCGQPVMDVGMEKDVEPYTEAEARAVFGEAVLGLEYRKHPRNPS
jgi:serine/threonine protein kinase